MYWVLLFLTVRRAGRVMDALVAGSPEERFGAVALLVSLPILVALGGSPPGRKTTPEPGTPPGPESEPWWGTIRSALRRNRPAAWGLRILMGLLVIAITCPIIAPHDPDLQPPDLPESRYRPPFTMLRFLTMPDGSTVATTEVLRDQDEIRYFRQGEWHRVEIPAEGIAERVQFHLLGTDGFGRDLFSRILYGTRISLAISLLAVTLAVGLGLLIGSIAGYAGGFADSLLMRLVDVGLSIPRLFLILAVVGLFHPSVLLLILLLGTTGWMDTARLVRAQILSLKTREFIQAARAIGQGVPTILFRHLLPNSIAPVLVEAALSTGNIILLEAALSYLGLGVQPPTASWGNLVSSGRDVLLDGWWISTFPGLAIVLTVVSLNLLGDGLREAFDPRFAGGGVQPPEGEDRPDSGDSETKRTSAWTVMLPGSMRISRRRISRILGRSAS